MLNDLIALVQVAALQALLADRVECTPALVAGTRGYAFTGDGMFCGLLANSTWPTTHGGRVVFCKFSPHNHG